MMGDVCLIVVALFESCLIAMPVCRHRAAGMQMSLSMPIAFGRFQREYV